MKIRTNSLHSIFEREFNLDVMREEPEIEYWRSYILQYLKDPSLCTCKMTRQQATKFVLWEKILLRKAPDGLLLKYLGLEEPMRVMAGVHK